MCVQLRPMKIPVLFLDDGGVLNDNTVRGPQWRRLVGEYFAPRLGGDPAAWAEANRTVTTSIFHADAWDALFLDDSPKALGWAAGVGACTLLVGHEAADGLDRIGSLAELPAWLEAQGANPQAVGATSHNLSP
jgi:hypothetical protein